MKKLLKLLFTGLLCNATFAVGAQAGKTFTIEECYRFARQNYPLVKQRDLIEKSKEFSIKNISHGLLPQINVAGQASYQSEVTQIPVKIPGMDVPTISKDQYKLYGDVSQALYDGGLIKEQKKLQEANSIIEEQQLEVQLYTLKERINQVFFGALLLAEQLQQNDLLKKDIQSGLHKAEALITNGTALKSSGDVLKAELLKADQRTTELEASRKAYLKILSLFINEALDDNSILIKPQGATISKQINRPELLFYKYQHKSIDAQKKIINAKNLPKINLFFQGGVGRPALNFLSNSVEPYYITGVRLNWFLSGLYNSKNDKALLEISRKSVDVQNETFLFNTNLSLAQENEEIIKMKKLLIADDEIITLRTNIKNVALAQLENGVINSNDYIREVNAEDMARQNKMLHEIQLLLAEYNQLTTAGN